MSDHVLYNLACDYATQGIKLLWFRLDKTPGIAWSTESSTNVDKLKEWFYHAEPGQRRIGIKTGQDSGGIVVIDIDVNKKDRSGTIPDCRSVEQKKEYIEETYGKLPETLEVHTPSGGRHLYYIADRPIATLKKIFPGDPLDVDSRGDGGVVIAPDGKDYISDNDFKIENMSPLPEWMYDILAKRNPLTRNKTNYTGIIPLVPEMEKAISDALMYMDFSDRDKWIKYGHAIKSLDSDDAKRLWHEWGQKHSGYDRDYTEKTWESFNPSEIGIQTLFYDARELGYSSENIDIVIKEQELRSITDKPRFELKDINDIFAERPPQQWLIKDLLIDPCLAMITGDAGCGKTWTSLDLAICIATGEQWLSREVVQGPVLIIDEESGDRRLATRLQKCINGHGGSRITPVYYFTMQGTDIRDALDINEIKKIIEDKKIKFVLIDAFMDVILGADENSVKDVLPGLNLLKKIIEETGVSFLIIHHKTKPSNGSKGNYRGSSAIKGAVDLMIDIIRNDNSDIIKMETTKFRDGEFTEFKAKMFFTDFSFNLTEDLADGNGLNLLSKGEKFVLEYLLNNGISYKIDIEKESENEKIKRSVHSAFSSLVEKHYIIRVNPGEHKSQYGIIDAKRDEIIILLESKNSGHSGQSLDI